MKLLIITQKVNKNDPILGFFHEWVKKLSERFETVSVVCLEKGEFDLPKNVKVFSLGKESGRNKIKYVSNFFRYIIGLAREYDTVFVHMNQEYILLGGLFWKIMGKKIFFWRNHPKGSFLTRIAVWLSEKVFYTSPQSYTAKFKKGVLMPVGIDTDLFKSETRNPKLETRKNKILSLGRISPVKNIHLMAEAAQILRGKGFEFIFDMVGNPINAEDFEYQKKLERRGAINFLPAVPNHKTPEVYNAHEIFINLTPSGSMDKTILESILCGCMPIVINEAYRDIFDENLIVKDDPEDIAEKIIFWFNAPIETKNIILEKLQKFVLENHSLNALVVKLISEIK